MRTCETCRHYGANTEFKIFAGKPIHDNQCVIAGRKRTTDPPRIVNPKTACELTFNMWTPKEKVNHK